MSSVGLCDVCESRAERGGSGKVAAMVCIMLWMRWFDCWNSMAIALMILWMLAACDLRVSVDASIFVSVLWLM